MAIEQISSEQAKKTVEIKAECAQSVAQQMEQKATEQLKKAKEELDKLSQSLAKIPEKAIKNLNEAIQKLMKIINGYEPPDDPEFDPAKIIAKLESLLKPVVSALSSLPVPKIPGLSDISKLLDALTSMISSTSDDTKSSTKKPKAEYPPNLKATLLDLLSAIQSLCTTLPLVLINLIFQMLDIIVGLFNDIAGVIGVPSIPYPLNLIPNCISMMPDIMKFALQVPGKLMNTVDGTLKQAYGKITSMQFPEVPDDVQKPELLSPCPCEERA